MWFVLILKCFIVEGYQEQIAQGAQQSQQDQNYIPQAGSQGSNTPKPSFLPRGNSRVFETAKPAHLTAHNSNQDYRWEVAGKFKLKILIKCKLLSKNFFITKLGCPRKKSISEFE